jgi:exonuclease VII large subunit
VLSRGYAIATRNDGIAVRAAEEVVVGETIAIRLARGSLDAVISARHVEPESIAASSPSPKEENAL